MAQVNAALLESTNGGEIRGWLKQKSKYLRAWRDRYIVFNSRTLKVLRSKAVITDATRHSAQVIDLEHYKRAIAEGSTSFSLSQKSQPKLTFKAPTTQCRDEWVTHINTALSNHQNTPSPPISCLALAQTLEHTDARADSQYRVNSENEEPQETDEQVTSLSDDDDDDDDDEDDTDKKTNLNEAQRSELDTLGYCSHDPLNNSEVADTVRGFIRLFASRDFMFYDLLRIIVNFYHSRFNSKVFVELVCDAEYLVVPRRNLSLARLLSTRVEAGSHRIEIDKVSASNLKKVLCFLNRHRGKEPAPIAKPIRSVRMDRICEDSWDAQFIDECSKKVIFQLILAANYLDCPSLLHLGCAKVSTLIKGKSPEEIKSILADKEEE